MKSPRALSLASAICVIPLLGWWMYGLFDLDEGFYGAVVAEMNRRGEWITPFYNGKPWFEKPILLYWLAKPAFALFGGEFGIRLPSILASLATYAMLAWFGRRRLGPASGAVAAIVLATSLFFVAIGRMVLVDPLLITCLTGAFLTFWESLVGDRRWRVASAALLGLGVLAKGPVAGALFILVLAYTFWRERDLRTAFGGASWWWIGTAVFAAVVAAWYVPAYLVDHRVFVQEFLIKQNLQRFKGGDEAHAVPMPIGLVYYVPVVLIGMFPWSLFIPRALPRRRAGEADAPLRRYLAAWALVVFAFFTISGTKLPHYVLPCFPPFALLVGHDMAGRWQGVGRARLAVLTAGAVFLGALLTFGFRAYYEAANSGPKRVADWLIAQTRAGEAPRSIAMFRLGKQADGLFRPVPKPMLLGRVPVGVNETSYPSFLFYLDPLFRSSPAATDPLVLETDATADLAAAAKPELILTRPGRLAGADRTSLAASGNRVTDLHAIDDPLVDALLVSEPHPAGSGSPPGWPLPTGSGQR